MSTPNAALEQPRPRPPAAEIVMAELLDHLRALDAPEDASVALVLRRLNAARILYLAYTDGDPLPGVDPLGWEQLSVIEVRRWVAVARAADGL